MFIVGDIKRLSDFKKRFNNSLFHRKQSKL